MRTLLHLLANLFLLLILAGCPSHYIKQSPVPSFTQTQGTPESLLSKASVQTSNDIANQYRLIAVDKYIQAKNLKKADDLLESITSELNQNQKMIYKMLKADIAFRNNDTLSTLKILSSSTFYQLDSQDTDLQVRVRLLKAKAFEKEGKALQALRERSYISSFLSGQQLVDNQNDIWRLAMSIPLDVLNTAADSGETGGWINLAKAVKSGSTLKDRQENINKWLSQNPTHPAAINPPQELITIKGLTSDSYTKIAILLPQKEKYGQAIYNGLMAAYYQTKNNDKITIKSYESTDFKSMENFYQQAQKDGIQLVIGPLDKKLVNELAQKTSLPIITLALNYADGNSHPSQLFQFGLLPEDEAKESAIRAFSDGKRHAVAIVPQGEWGRKVLTAFRTQWEQLGGVLEGIQYIDRPIDLDNQLASLTAKLPINNENDSATDNNMLFLVADPLIARQIRSLLIYHDQDKLSVYATSHIYSGTTESTQNNDLNGVLFTETPWLLFNDNPIQQQIINQWPQAQGSFARLYALGVDAWLIYPRLDELKSLPNSRVEGLSGEITIDANQKVIRKLPWATFEKGLIKPAPQSLQ